MKTYSAIISLWILSLIFSECDTVSSELDKSESPPDTTSQNDPGDKPKPGPQFPKTYHLVSYQNTYEGYENVGPEIDKCHVNDGGWTFLLKSAQLIWTVDDAIKLKFQGLRYQSGGGWKEDSLATSAVLESYGHLARLRQNADRIWFATIGPDYSNPSTIILSDVGNTTDRYLGSPRCARLVFADTTSAVDRSILPDQFADKTFRGKEWIDGETTISFPHTFRVSSWVYNYDSARVSLKIDGSYKYQLWKGAEEVAEDGMYSISGPIIIFDPNGLETAMGLVSEDSLVVYDHRWEFYQADEMDLFFISE